MSDHCAAIASRTCNTGLLLRPHKNASWFYSARLASSPELSPCSSTDMSSSGECSPVPSPEPENVACYEECITDEIFIPPSPLSGDAVSSSSSEATGLHGIPKSNASGRITKRGIYVRRYSFFFHTYIL